MVTRDSQRRNDQLSGVVDALNAPTRLEFEGVNGAAALVADIMRLRDEAGDLSPSEQLRLMEEMLTIAADQVELWIGVREAVLDFVLPDFEHLSDRRVGELACLSGQAIRRRRDGTLTSPKPGRPRRT